MLLNSVARRACSTAAAATRISGPIGFIGLGNMGGHMAENLCKSGRKVVVHDINAFNVARLEKTGAESAASPAAVAEQVQTIITMLPSTPHVYDVYCQDKGILSKINKGTLLIDCSTIDPDMSKRIHKSANSLGCTFVDAPVSGGVIGAQNAGLTFMVGSHEKDFQEVAAVLTPSMGKNAVHCGDVGMGQVAKLCNNLVLGITMAGVCEAFQIGTTLGMDPQRLASVINSSSGRSWSSEVYNPCPGVMEGVPSSRDYEGGFACDLMAKDLSLAASAASQAKVAMPMGSVAHQLYLIMSAQGMGGKDFSALYKMLKKPAEKS